MAIRKRTILKTLTRARLLDIAWSLDCEGVSRLRKEEIIDAIASMRKASVNTLLDLMYRDELKTVCRVAGLSDKGTAREVLIERIKPSGKGTPPPHREESVEKKSSSSEGIEQNESSQKDKLRRPQAKKTITPSREACPVCGTEKHTLVACPSCGWQRGGHVNNEEFKERQKAQVEKNGKSQTPERNYRECPVCHSNLRENNFDRHMQKQHSPEAERRKEEEREARKEARRLEKEEGRKIVSCDLCGIKLAKRNLKKHKKKCHKLFNPTYPDAKLSHMTSAEKKRYLNRFFGRDKEYSEDVFDRGVIIHGGAWGLGKNRKH